jgi:hypothetical protein
VRRSRLYYLRDLHGKKARLRTKLRDLSGLISEEEAERADQPNPAMAADDAAATETAESAEGKDAG